jgi:Dehydrogenases with different specificities (related to short-chain alcohol dehydrogenases)
LPWFPRLLIFVGIVSLAVACLPARRQVRPWWKNESLAPNKINVTEDTVMRGRLDDKKALITGGASDIGRATALRFAEEGADVFIADRADVQGADVVEEIRARGGKALFGKTDVSDWVASISRG